MIAHYVDAATENSCAVHGPLAPEPAAAEAVRLVSAYAAEGEAALPAADPGLDRLGLVDRLVAAGVHLVQPDAPDWRDRLAIAPVGVTSAALAVAATGTLVLAAAPDAPRATSLVPPVHVCVLWTGDVVDDIAEALAVLSERGLPSALTWIGGPSRTSDLEMQPTLGVHGPKVVEVVVVESAT